MSEQIEAQIQMMWDKIDALQPKERHSKGEKGHIYKAIPKIMSEMEAIGKNKNASGGGMNFKFRGIDDVYNHLQKVMAKHGVFSSTEITNRRSTDIVSRNGGKGVLRLNSYDFTLFAEDGSWVKCEADGEAADYGDKASGKCASYAHKYALLQTFLIPTEDLEDPDSVANPEIAERGSEQNKTSGKGKSKPSGQRSNQTGPKPKNETPVTENQLKRLYAIQNKHGWDNDQISEIISLAWDLKSTKELKRFQYDWLIGQIEGGVEASQVAAAIIDKKANG